ncbi:unnamed protein product [Musa acuminata subsp. burmannicoides]
MDGGVPVGGNGGGGGPAPFLLKTYEMVDDASTDAIVSWSSTGASFVVWNPIDFVTSLLPMYFKHNNFSSFVRQLNTYVRKPNFSPSSRFVLGIQFLGGFKKIDPERWEFANDDFVKGQNHLLKKIHRRKPTHSHSHPPGGGLADAERVALEGTIERLNQEKAGLEDIIQKFMQQKSGTEIQIEDLERRLADMEQRHLKILAFVQRALQKPELMANLMKMAVTSSMDISVIHKKRRLPPDVDHSNQASVNNLRADRSTSTIPEKGYILDQDFCEKLKLELSSGIPDDNLITVVTHSSNEDNDCGQELECLPSTPETLQLCGTGAPLCSIRNAVFVREIDEDDGLFPCHLGLTLASSAMEIDGGKFSSRTPDLVDQGAAHATDLETSNTARENDLTIPVATIQSMVTQSTDAKVVSSQEVPPSNEASAVHIPANDVFWQQFLTERPERERTQNTTLRSDSQEEEMAKLSSGFTVEKKSLILWPLLLLLLLLLPEQATASGMMVKLPCSGRRRGQGCLLENGVEMEMSSEESRRLLWAVTEKKYISYEALKGDVVPCNKPGVPYYNCHVFPKANPYNRGCQIISGCRGDSP